MTINDIYYGTKQILIIICLSTVCAASDIPSGSLLFIDDGNAIVKQFTQSDITHVAIIAKENGNDYVFEAIKPKVKKTLLEDYLKETKEKIYLVVPNEKYIKIDNEKLLSYLNEQLDKKYSIENYNNPKPNDKTTFCSQLVVDCYNHCGTNVFIYYSQYYYPGKVWETMMNKKYSSVYVLKERN